jgi:hypothetical protein
MWRLLKVSAFITAIIIAIGVLASSQNQPDVVPGESTPDGLDRKWTTEDWAIFSSKVRYAAENQLDTAPLSQVITQLAISFVGTTYTPGTLEVDGPESLVINLRELDCVTFVETVLALTRFIRNDGHELLNDPPSAQAQYERYLTELRYREGVINGYASRLHYFSEWLRTNERKGLLHVITNGLTPESDDETIDFMSTHPTMYRQLVNPVVLESIREMEKRINAQVPRAYVPEGRIKEISPLIQDGDVIAATSTVPGLDIAHTGFAIWLDGSLHLLHAPLIGSEVEISELPLSDRISSIPSQDGIMVARAN